MRYDTIGRGLLALRHRKRLRQEDVSRVAGVSRTVVSELEHGRLERHALAALVRTAHAVGASVRVDLVIPGADVFRLLDADHAALQTAWLRRLRAWGWQVEPEVTFNHFGERGSIDILAWHAATRHLVVLEVKTILVDLQELHAGLDRKVRIGRALAAERGWPFVGAIPALVVAEGSTARRQVGRHDALFGRLDLRGRVAAAWLRLPTAPAPHGLLCFTDLSAEHPDDGRTTSRQRIRSGRVRPAP
ncbi:MAG TPA: helix-turn-helix domain-containing protein [Candidatus Limnocylindria bacterium]